VANHKHTMDDGGEYIVDIAKVPVMGNILMLQE
jgi:hypothetical protein